MVPSCTRRIHRSMNMGNTQAHVVLIVAAADQLMSLSSFHRPPADLPVMGDTRTPTDTSLTLRGHYDHKRNGKAGGSRGVRIHKVPEIMFSWHISSLWRDSLEFTLLYFQTMGLISKMNLTTGNEKTWPHISITTCRRSRRPVWPHCLISCISSRYVSHIL